MGGDPNREVRGDHYRQTVLTSMHGRIKRVLSGGLIARLKTKGTPQAAKAVGKLERLQGASRIHSMVELCVGLEEVVAAQALLTGDESR